MYPLYHAGAVGAVSAILCCDFEQILHACFSKLESLLVLAMFPSVGQVPSWLVVLYMYLVLMVHTFVLHFYLFRMRAGQKLADERDAKEVEQNIHIIETPIDRKKLLEKARARRKTKARVPTAMEVEETGGT